MITLLFFNSFIYMSYFLVKSTKVRPYSLNTTFWIFNLIFFCVTPYIQYSNNIFPWGSIWGDISEKELIYACLMVILFNSVYLVTYHKRVIRIKKYHTPPILFVKNSGRKVKLSEYLVFATIVLFFFYNSMFKYSTSSSSLLLIINKTSLGMMYYSFLYILYRNFQINKHILTARSIFVFFLFLLYILLGQINGGGGRNASGSFAIALVLLVFNKKIISFRFSYIIMMVLGLMFLFPYLGSLRTHHTVESSFEQKYSQFLMKSDQTSISDNQLINSYVSGDFDAFSIIPRTVSYVGKNGYSYGYQFLGPLFFYVPRAWWPEKPIGSGAVIVQHTQDGFSNISCPYLAEFYINFGPLGLIFGAWLLAVILSKADVYFWSSSQVHWVHFVYLFSIGYLFFILRGDLLSSTAYLFGVTAGCYLAYRIFSISRKGSA